MAGDRTRHPPRRRPRQVRSKGTVEAIVEATARVLSERGYTKTTTARIAKVAGVSIGSLYQYFPSKAALMTALLDRELARTQEHLSLFLAEAGSLEPPALIRAYVRAVVARFGEDPELYRVLVEEIPAVAGTETSHAADERNEELLRSFLASLGDRLAASDLDVAAFLVVRSVRYCALSFARKKGTRGELDEAAFVEQLAQLALKYLLSPAID